MNADQARQVLLDAASVATQDLGNFTVRGQVLAGSTVKRFELVDQMARDVVRDLGSGIEALSRRQFLAYDPSYQTSTSQVLVEDLAEIPELAAVDAVIRNADVDEDSGGADVVAMVHALGLGAGQVVAYRLKGPGIATRRASGITLIPRKGIYRPVTGDILFYEPRFDVFTCAGYAYFTTVTLIQSKLQADAKARQLARDTLRAVTANVRVDGYAQLQVAVMDDPTLRAKMASVARLLDTDPDYGQFLTTEKLVAFVEAYPDYAIPVSTVNGEKMLQFDPSPQHRHQIPRLLADDYLHSYLTNRHYEAGSKQRTASG